MASPSGVTSTPGTFADEVTGGSTSVVVGDRRVAGEFGVSSHSIADKGCCAETTDAKTLKKIGRLVRLN